jgi:hypothetical protein
MAGEGSLEERGLRPLSNSLPLKHYYLETLKTTLFEGDQGGE